MIGHLEVICLVEELKVVLRGVLDELREGERVVQRGEINSNELAFWKFPRHRDEVVAVAVTEFECAVTLHW